MVQEVTATEARLKIREWIEQTQDYKHPCYRSPLSKRVRAEIGTAVYLLCSLGLVTVRFDG